jgi:hypothetical protein
MRILNKMHWVGESHGGETSEERSAKEVEHIQEECLWEDRGMGVDFVI